MLGTLLGGKDVCSILERTNEEQHSVTHHNSFAMASQSHGIGSVQRGNAADKQQKTRGMRDWDPTPSLLIGLDDSCSARSRT